MIKTNTQTITLNGTEQEVRFNRNYPYFWVQNQGSSDVLMSIDSDIAEGKDGVMSVLSGGGTACTMHGYDLDRFYLLGKGKVQVVGTYSAHCPFKPALGGGDNTASGATYYSLSNAADYPLLGLNLYGKSTQDGTPTPENPVDIISVCDSGTLNITSDNGNDISVSAEISSALPLRSVGDVCDELIYNADGTGKSVKRIGKYTFTGNESFALRGNRDNMYMYSVTNALQFKRGLQAFIICDKYKNVGNAENWQAALNLLSVNEICVWNSTDNCTVYFGSSCSDLDSFKTEVAGATVVYQLPEPTETELTATETASLRELQTFGGITNISNDGGADMGVKYCTNNMLSKCVMPVITSLQAQIDELNAAVLSLGSNV